MKGSPGDSGFHYMKLVSTAITGIGVVPGVAVSGTIDMTTFQPKSGFAFAARPYSLDGNWQYMAYGSDQGHIAILLTKWNSGTNMRDTVAFTDYPLPIMAMTWTAFTIPLNYYSGATPDSAVIVLSASGSAPVDKSYLYVDNLKFTGTAVAAVPNVSTCFGSTSIFPNPASNSATILYTSDGPSPLHISVLDAAGRIVSQTDVALLKGANRFSLNTSGFAPGSYLVTMTTGRDDLAQKQLIIK